MSSIFRRGALIATLMASSSIATAQSNEPNAGAYLAARQAGQMHDFEFGASYFTEALLADPTNPDLLEGALASNISLGRFSDAISIARGMKDLGLNSQVANIMLAAQAIKTERWEDIFTGLEMDQRIGPVVDRLSQGWAQIGLSDFDKAIETFDEISTTEGMQSFGIQNKALALASVGNFEEAIRVLGGAIRSGGLRHNRRSAIAHAQILTQLDRREDAAALLDTIFGETRDPRLNDLHDRIVNGGEVPFDVVTNPTEGMAEIYLAVAEALRNDAPDAYTLVYARTAEYLEPDNTEALLLVAGLLDDLERFELANTVYAAVSRDDPAYAIAELGRAEALSKADNLEGAIEVLRNLSRDFPDLPDVYVSLGDTLRQNEQTAEANAAYTQAVDLFAPEDPAQWIVLYARAVTYHQLDEWPEAEADFRAALAFRPDQPQVLNYLGYSLVERDEKLEEALEMIEKAVAAQPQNGAIVDSLGWVLFQTGQYEEAVGHLEDAAALEAVDPVVNDHLGDAFWAVGREIEARFQWNRALSFSDEDSEEASRIRRKLEIGLDAVLVEEGAPPLRVADGNE